MGKTLVVAHNGWGYSVPDNSSPIIGMYPYFGTSTQAFAWRAIGSGTVRNLAVYVTANSTRLVTSTFTVRKNGTNQTLKVTYASGAAGLQTDTSNSFTVADGDDIDIELAVPNDTSGARTVNVRAISFEFESDTGTVSRIGTSAASSVSTSTASTTYYLTPGGVDTLNSTEHAARLLTGYTASDLYAYVASNGRSTTTTVRSRKNGANGGQSVSFGSGETGVKTDTSGTDSLASGDDFCWSFTTGTGTGTIALGAVGSALSSDNNEWDMFHGRNAGLAMSAGVTYFLAPSGSQINPTLTEVRGRAYQYFDSHYTDLRAYVTANAATAASTIAFRVSGVDSALSLSYAAGETGVKTDTDVVDVTSSEPIGYRVENGTGGGLTLSYVGVTGYTDTGGGSALTIDLADTITLSDALAKAAGLIKADSGTLSDTLSKRPGLAKSDAATPSDALVRAVGKLVADTSSTSDQVVKLFGITKSDASTVSDVLAKLIGVSPSDTVTSTDTVIKSVSITLSDVAALADAISKGLVKPLSDASSTADSLTKGLGPSVSDGVSATDAVTKSVSMILADAITLLDELLKSLSRSLADTASVSDALSKSIGVVQADSLTISDALAKSIAISKSDTASLADLLTYVHTLPPNSQASLSCVINSIYTMLCRDEETAADGLDPRDSTLHASGFYRHTRSKLEHLTGSAIDRKVQVVLNTVSSTFKSQLAKVGLQRKVPLVIRVGYFVGDHATESMSVMAGDDYDIQRLVSREENWTCGNVILTPISSAPLRVDSTRYINEIQVEVQL